MNWLAAGDDTDAAGPIKIGYSMYLPRLWCIHVPVFSTHVHPAVTDRSKDWNRPKSVWNHFKTFHLWLYHNLTYSRKALIRKWMAVKPVLRVLHSWISKNMNEEFKVNWNNNNNNNNNNNKPALGATSSSHTASRWSGKFGHVWFYCGHVIWIKCVRMHSESCSPVESTVSQLMEQNTTGLRQTEHTERERERELSVGLMPLTAEGDASAATLRQTEMKLNHRQTVFSTHVDMLSPGFTRKSYEPPALLTSRFIYLLWNSVGEKRVKVAESFVGNKNAQRWNMWILNKAAF